LGESRPDDSLAVVTGGTAVTQKTNQRAKIVVLIRRKPELSREQFIAYYEGTHAPFALRYIRPYLLDYRRSYPTSSFSYFDAVENASGATGKAGYNYDCITEMWFADRGQLDAMFAKLAEPEVRRAIAADEARFLDPQSVVVITCDERVTDLAVSA
jgi:hypothetical protein